MFFGHIFPISNGHIAFHLFFVRALGDIDRFIIFFPEFLESVFAVGEHDVDFFVRMHDRAFAHIVESGFAAYGVVYDERLVFQAPDKMGEDKFEDIIVGFEWRVKNAAASLHKAQKARKAVRFEGDFAHFLRRGDDGRMRKHVWMLPRGTPLRVNISGEADTRRSSSPPGRCR